MIHQDKTISTHLQKHQLVHLVVRTQGFVKAWYYYFFQLYSTFFSGGTKFWRSGRMTEVAHCQTLEIYHKSCSSMRFKVSSIIIANLLLLSVITKQTQSTTHLLHQIKKLIS